MPADLTAILLPLPPRGLSPDQIVNLVAQSGAAAAWVRLCPFDKLEIHQLEVLEGNTGLPAVSPALLTALSEGINQLLTMSGYEVPGVKQILYGVALGLAIMFMPGGIWPVIARKLGFRRDDWGDDESG